MSDLGRDISWGPDFMQAMKETGLIADEVILQNVTIEHDQEYSVVMIQVHLRPSQFKMIADHLAAQIDEGTDDE